MIELTRRSALAGAAVTTMAAAGGLTPEWARAATAPAAAQAPGFYRYKVGSIEITVITDGANRLPVTDEFVLNVKKEEVNAALAEAFMEPGVFVGPYNPIVINTGAKLALVDTGTGEAAYRRAKARPASS
jgi:ABC-type glycerol-3-phosphate transport system substrate-binding protein